MQIMRDIGRRMLFWGCILLILWAGYEFSVRWDVLSKTNRSIAMMAMDHHIPLWDVLFKYRYIDALKVPLLLAACVVLGVVTLLLRRRPAAALVIIPVCIALAWLSVDAKAFFSASLWQMLKLLPLLLITLGSLINLLFHLKRRSRPSGPRPGTEPGVRRFH
ncbi:MAG: hypothetical protein GX650_05235 [Clostridiales bacterium]|nr:hypothetical protein [Clostridiales bacterium]